jgi:ankyrin repeat protein
VLLALLADGADPAVLDGAKDTPLHAAARAGQLGALQLLLKPSWGAPWHAVNEKGETFADAAAPGGGAFCWPPYARPRCAGGCRCGAPALAVRARA